MRVWSCCALVATLVLLGCSHQVNPVDREGRRIFRIGFLANLTHAPALVGIQAKVFQEHMGPNVVVKSLIFTAGPSVVEAIFAGELDVAYLGPNPAINAYVRTKGSAVRIIAGSTSGGAALVVQPDIETIAELAARNVASPAIANTQDIALRTWLHEQGYRARDEGGTVDLVPLASSDSFTLFKRGSLAGAWVPEPWASKLLLEGGGKVFVDEISLWPRGLFPTTVVIATTGAMKSRPDLVQTFVDAHREAIALLGNRPAMARAKAIDFLREKANMQLSAEVVERAFDQLTFATDPLEPELQVLADRAIALEYLQGPVQVGSIIDWRFLPEEERSPKQQPGRSSPEP